MAENETRLGKGLGALLGENVGDGGEGGRSGPEREVPVDRVRPNPYQPRTDFEAGSLGELVESIRENGLLQPLVVRPADDGWELVAGERRWRALRELGWERAPAVVRELEDDQMLILALVENLQRENLSALEEAMGYRKLIESFELTQQQVAERVGRDRSTVSNMLRLLELEGLPRELLAAGEISASHARAILGLERPEDREALAEEVVEEELSVRETERRARRMKAGDEGASGDGGDGDGGGDDGGSRDDPVARRAEQMLERALGTEVRVRLKGEREGEIGVVFHDGDEFERVCRHLAGDDADSLFGA